MKKIVRILSLMLVVMLAFTVVSCKEGDDGEEGGMTLREHLMKEAQVVADFIRDNDFIYGDARINPAINWEHLDPEKAIDPSEKRVSCDRLVDWILYRVGYTDQPYTQGVTVWALPGWCESQGFEKIENLEELQAGDIVFVNPNADYKPAHTFMCASSMNEDGTFLRYDAGSDARIQCNKGTEYNAGSQPFLEPITGFMYAYRPNDLMLDKDYPDDDNDDPLAPVATPDIGISFEIHRGTATVDAAIADGEYKTSYVMDKSSCSPWVGSSIGNNKTTIYMSWDDSGFYYAAEVTDSTPGYRGDKESWVGADCVQIAFNPGYLMTGNYTDGIFFTFGAKEDGSVVTYRNNYKEGIISDKVTAKAAGHTSGSASYIIEAFIPWSEMQLKEGKIDTTTFAPAAGVDIGVLPCVIDSKEDGNTINTAYKFKNTTFKTSGYVPAKLVD